MLKKLYELARRLLVISQDTERNKSEIRELQHQMQDLTAVVQELGFEVRRIREDHQHEREKMILRLENASLRLEQRLLTVGDGADRGAGHEAAGES